MIKSIHGFDMGPTINGPSLGIYFINGGKHTPLAPLKYMSDYRSALRLQPLFGTQISGFLVILDPISTFWDLPISGFSGFGPLFGPFLDPFWTPFDQNPAINPTNAPRGPPKTDPILDPFLGHFWPVLTLF